jgi:minimal PKS acyl carrier protein
MNPFTLNDLRVIMRESAGELEVDARDADLAETSYSDLGYDSLALLDVTARIRQALDVHLPEEAVACTATPAATVAAVNLLVSQRWPQAVTPVMGIGS